MSDYLAGCRQKDRQVLEQAKRYLDEVVGPNAAAIDSDEHALQDALDGLCRLKLMAVKRPEKYGGPELEETAYREFQELVARNSGALAFLQTQHQSAVSMIARSANETLKSTFLPLMDDGRKLVGIGFSQLRRTGPPLLRAKLTEAGYLINGQVPWATGHQFFGEILVGAGLPDGRAVFGIAPFVDQERSDGSVDYGEPMQLAAMGSARTVVGTFDNWLMPHNLVCDVKPPGWIHTNDQINIAIQGFFALGCSRGSLDVIWSRYEKLGHDFIRATHDALQEEIDECRSAMIDARLLSGEETTAEQLRLRAWSIDLAVRCGHAAVAASSGAANLHGNPAQRLYREALVYTVSAQTVPIMRATLERLVARGSPPGQGV